MSNPSTFNPSGETSSVSAFGTIVWIGRIVSGLAVLFLLFDDVIKALQLAPAVEATVQLGYPERLVVVIGILELICLAIYAFPRTAVLGAILLTGYLGGAIATQVRAGAHLFPIVFPMIMGALTWGGLFLREPRLGTLIPLRS